MTDLPETSDRLALPFLLPAQAQKHVTHNEALERLDALVQLTVESAGLQAPPQTPAPEAAFLLGSGASGDWEGHDGEIAVRAGAGWILLVPRSGWRLWDRGRDEMRVFDGADWRLPPAERQNLEGLGIRATADAVNRLSLAAEATLLSHAGGSHRLKVNRAGAQDTASLLFQSGFSGRAEMGLAGSADFSVKVSADGGSWHEALRAEADSGRVALPRLRSGELEVADGAVGTIPLPGAAGLLLLAPAGNAPQAGHSGLFAYVAGGTPALQALAAGPETDSLGSAALTGTSGTAGRTSLAMGAAGIVVENRSGAARGYCYTFLG